MSTNLRQLSDELRAGGESTAVIATRLLEVCRVEGREPASACMGLDPELQTLAYAYMMSERGDPVGRIASALHLRFRLIEDPDERSNLRQMIRNNVSADLASAIGEEREQETRQFLQTARRPDDLSTLRQRIERLEAGRLTMQQTIDQLHERLSSLEMELTARRSAELVL